MDGSFTTGCAVSAVVAVAGYPVLGMVLGFVAGSIAGMVTGLLITKLNINEILAGILTQTALYSVNLRIMHQTPNISLFNHKTIFSSTTQFEPYYWCDCDCDYRIIELFLKDTDGACT